MTVQVEEWVKEILGGRLKLTPQKCNVGDFVAIDRGWSSNVMDVAAVAQPLTRFSASSPPSNALIPVMRFHRYPMRRNLESGGAETVTNVWKRIS